MTGVYRKRGAVTRWENGWVVRVTEAGEAIDDGKSFVARPFAGDVPRLVDFSLTWKDDDAQRGMRACERLILTEGIADHECDGIRWSERTRRLHASLTHGAHRALLDLADFDFALLERVAGALERGGGEREVPRPLRLAPHVTAALLPSLVDIIEVDQLPAQHDGRGMPVVARRVAGPPPNVWRPSYRVRPLPMWHNLRARPFGAIDRSAPEAVALLDGGTRLLLEDGSMAALRLERVLAVGEPQRWYPIGAGSFGAEMLL
jgi:hypothetical protein